MKTIYPVLTREIKSGRVSIKKIAKLIDSDERTVIDKLQGTGEFTINEAMNINIELLSQYSFEQLFSENQTG